jgi:hypothetical protein
LEGVRGTQKTKALAEQSPKQFMNNSELENLFKSAPVPDRSPEYWEQFPTRVTSQLKEQSPAPGVISQLRPKHFWLTPALCGGFGLAVACLMVGFFLGYWKGSGLSKRQLASMQESYHELEELFPNQVQAIIFEGREVRLVLAERPEVPSSTPIAIQVTQKNSQRKFVTFSGQQIQINGETCEVLADAQGHIILLGKNWVWSDAGGQLHHEPYRIEARKLGEVL